MFLDCHQQNAVVSEITDAWKDVRSKMTIARHLAVVRSDANVGFIYSKPVGFCYQRTRELHKPKTEI